MSAAITAMLTPQNSGSLPRGQDGSIKLPHKSKGDFAEAVAIKLLLERGYSVRNLNDTRNNNPSVDLEAEGIGSPFLVSVKSCWTPNRQLRLGSPASVSALPDGAFVLAFLPRVKGEPLDLSPGGHVVWIVPAVVAREEALAAHWHYASHNPGSAKHSVMVKDKTDRSEKTRSGALFHRWASLYESAWHLLPPPFDAVE